MGMAAPYQITATRQRCDQEEVKGESTGISVPGGHRNAECRTMEQIASHHQVVLQFTYNHKGCSCVTQFAHSVVWRDSLHHRFSMEYNTKMNVTTSRYVCIVMVILYEGHMCSTCDQQKRSKELQFQGLHNNYYCESLYNPSLRWLKQEYELPFPLSKQPPVHMPIAYGLVDISKPGRGQGCSASSSTSNLKSNNESREKRAKPSELCEVCKTASNVSIIIVLISQIFGNHVLQPVCIVMSTWWLLERLPY